MEGDSRLKGESSVSNLTLSVDWALSLASEVQPSEVDEFLPTNDLLIWLLSFGLDEDASVTMWIRVVPMLDSGEVFDLANWIVIKVLIEHEVLEPVNLVWSGSRFDSPSELQVKWQAVCDRLVTSRRREIVVE